MDWRKVRFYGLAPEDTEQLREGLTNGGLIDANLLHELRRRKVLVESADSADRRSTARWMRTMKALIAVVGLGPVLRLIDAVAPRYGRADPPPAEFTHRLREQIAEVSRRSWWVGGDCKTTALTAYVLTRRQGYAATLQIGLREHPFTLHAWTSCGDVDIPDRTPGGYEFRPILVLGT